ncbi:MAG: pyruvate ferredoxin oxidoreductase [Prevotellaceae bacterium]|nr:pyruvate ferredoxin oxidoreductase [Prevotella sp.]MDD7256981.1 pyruvate ferredoxin oxidoreductase [Prevotellaceae bacterium]MDY6130370.1 pyruvate ferredoxin oxidoreductase [Prevotella sp.]
MDYKYIEQLLERYWNCETSLEEEEILRMFFSQTDVPANLLPYRDLFLYEQNEKREVVLGEEFDQRMMDVIGEAQPVKARVVRLPQRLMPLFKAAAVVAIILTLGNAAQVAFNDNAEEAVNVAGYQKVVEGPSVAMGDSVQTDTLKKAIQPTATIILK